MKIKLVTAILFLSFASAGCLGGSPPQQRFLRITDTGVCKEKTGQEAKETLIIAVKDFKSLLSLDRTNVLISNNRVLAPSHSWYWEATPAETLTMTVADRISFSNSFSSAWPYRPRIERDAVLTGYVTSFAAELDPPGRFIASVRIELWNERGREKLAEKEFDVSSEVPGFNPEELGDPNSLAQNAADAVCIMGNEIRAWLEENEQLIRNQ